MLKLDRFNPIIYKLNKIVPIFSKDDSQNKKKSILAPGDIFEASKAVCLPNEFDRVVFSDEYSSIEDQFKRVFANEFQNSPTILYNFKNAIISRGSIYTKHERIYIKKDGTQTAYNTSNNFIRDGLICSNWATELFFGHWVRDGLCLEMIGKELGLNNYAYDKHGWPNEIQYRFFTGLSVGKLVDAIAENIYIVDDRGLNKYWRSRFHNLRNLLKDKCLSINGQLSKKNIYISRGPRSSTRSLMNEDELIINLEKIGFEILEPTGMSVSDIFNKIHNADLCIAVEGSQINHVHMAMRAGGKLLIIQPPRRFNAIHKFYCDVVGIKFGFVIGDDRGDGFSIDINRLLRSLDLMV